MKRRLFKLVLFKPRLLLYIPAGALFSVLLALLTATIGIRGLPRPIRSSGNWTQHAITDRDNLWLSELGWLPTKGSKRFSTKLYSFKAENFGYDIHVLQEIKKPIIPEGVTSYTITYMNTPPFASQIRAGWPLICVRGERFIDWKTWSPHDDEVKSAIRLPHASVNVEVGEILPIGIVWGGFVINTLFYATILMLLVGGSAMARSLARDKSGMCIKCGYDLRGSSKGGCPECGWGREEEA